LVFYLPQKLLFHIYTVKLGLLRMESNEFSAAETKDADLCQHDGMLCCDKPPIKMTAAQFCLT